MAVIVGVGVRVGVAVLVVVGVTVGVAVSVAVGVEVAVGLGVAVGARRPVPESATTRTDWKKLTVNVPRSGPRLSGLKVTDAVHWVFTGRVLGQLFVDENELPLIETVTCVAV